MPLLVSIGISFGCGPPARVEAPPIDVRVVSMAGPVVGTVTALGGGTLDEVRGLRFATGTRPTIEDCRIQADLQQACWAGLQSRAGYMYIAADVAHPCHPYKGVTAAAASVSSVSIVVTFGAGQCPPGAAIGPPVLSLLAIDAHTLAPGRISVAVHFTGGGLSEKHELQIYQPGGAFDWSTDATYAVAIAAIGAARQARPAAQLIGIGLDRWDDLGDSCSNRGSEKRQGIDVLLGTSVSDPTGELFHYDSSMLMPCGVASAP